MSVERERVKTFITSLVTKIEASNFPLEYKFVQDSWRKAQQGFCLGLEAQILLLDRQEPEPFVNDKRVAIAYRKASKVFEIVQSILHYHREADLYFFLEVVRRDLGLLETPIVLKSGDAFRSISLENDIEGPISGIDQLKEVELYGDAGPDLRDKIREKRVRIIDTPSAEISDVYSWAIVCHETFHFVDGIAPLVNEIVQDRDPLFQQYALEIVIDFVTYYYLGPIYSKMMVELAQKAGTAESNEHPPAKARWLYLSRLLKRDLEAVSSGTYRKITTELIKSRLKELDEAIQASKKSESEKLDSVITKYFPEIFSMINAWLQKRNISSWHEELTMGLDQSHLGILSEGQVAGKAKTLFMNRIAPTMKPTTLLNLSLLFPEVDAESMREALLFTFRRWFVWKEVEGRPPSEWLGK